MSHHETHFTATKKRSLRNAFLLERYLNGSEVPVLPVIFGFYGGTIRAPVKTGVHRSSWVICPHTGKMGLNFFKGNGLFSCENKPFVHKMHF